MAKKIKLDPNEFALSVVSGMNQAEDDDNFASKKALKRYLTSYLLAEEFNKFESEQFKITKTQNFELLVKAIDGLKFD